MSRTPNHAVAPANLRVMEGTTVALKVAYAATEVLPIVGQILGSAAHISEFADRLQRRRDAMYELAERSAIYARQIEEVLAGGTADETLLRRLQRLSSVFSRIEAFMLKESSVKGWVRRMIRSVFIAPNCAVTLAMELEREIQLFHLATAVESRLLGATSSLYDGEFRLLRHGDVQKQDLLAQHEVDDCVITWASARVDGECMVVRYMQPVDGKTGERTISQDELSCRWHTYLNLVKRLSVVQNSHRNVVQLYGRHVGSCFTVFRSSAGNGFGYYLHLKDLSRDERAVKQLHVLFKILDAARHLTEEHHLVWVPRTTGLPAHSVAVDDLGEPTIGLFDDIEEASAWEPAASAMTRCYLEILHFIAGDCHAGQAPGDGSNLRRVKESLAPILSDFRDGGHRAVLEQLEMEVSESGIDHRLLSLPIPLTDMELQPSMLLQGVHYFHDILRASTCAKAPHSETKYEIQHQPPQGSNSWVLLSYAPSDPQSLLIMLRRAQDDGCFRYESFTIPLSEYLLADVKTVLGTSLGYFTDM